MEMYSIEAEVEVLGAMLYKKEFIVKALERLKEKDFYLEKHKIIFRNIIALYGEGEDISLVTLINKIGKSNLNKVAGITYLSELLSSGMVINIDSYIKILKDKTLKREGIRYLNLAIKELQKDKSSGKEVLSKLQGLLLSDYLEERKMVSDYELFNKTLEEIEKRYNFGRAVWGMETGFKAFDLRIDGFQKGELTIIGGRPSMGKTAMALAIGDGLARHGNTVCLFEMEMGEEMIGARRLSYNSNIKFQNIKKAKLLPEDFEKLVETSHIISKKNNMYTDCSSSQSVDSIRAKAMALKGTKGLDAIIIDHLALIEMEDKKDRHHEIAVVTRRLKILAKELDINVILLCQLSRGVEQRQNKRPLLSDLRESGSIEQDADLVIFAYRDEYYTRNECKKKGVMEWIIAKNRNGEVGILEFKYLKEYQKIEPLK